MSSPAIALTITRTLGSVKSRGIEVLAESESTRVFANHGRLNMAATVNPTNNRSTDRRVFDGTAATSRKGRMGSKLISTFYRASAPARESPAIRPQPAPELKYYGNSLIFLFVPGLARGWELTRSATGGVLSISGRYCAVRLL